MTTKDKIKALIVADKKITQVIGALPHLCDYDDKQNNADILMSASNTIQEVIDALCDELPDNTAEPDKAFCPKCRTLCCLERENPEKRGMKRVGYCPVCIEFFETDCANIEEAAK